MLQNKQSLTNSEVWSCYLVTINQNSFQFVALLRNFRPEIEL